MTRSQKYATQVTEMVRGLSSDLEQISRKNGGDINIVVTPPENGGPSRSEPDRAALVWRCKYWIALIAVTAAAITFGISHLVPATYSSSATIRVSGQPVNGVLSAVTASNQLAKQYAEIVDSPAVLSAAADTLHTSTSTLRSSVSAGTVNDQNLVSISADGSSPSVAARRADVVARSFIGYIRHANARQALSVARGLNGGRATDLSSQAADAAVAAQPSVESVGPAGVGAKVSPKPVLYSLIAFAVAALIAAQAFVVVRSRRA